MVSRTSIHDPIFKVILTTYPVPLLVWSIISQVQEVYQLEYTYKCIQQDTVLIHC
jgi:hypothetical protein